MFSQEKQTRSSEALERSALIKKEDSLLYKLQAADIASLVFGLNSESIFDRFRGANSTAGLDSWAMHTALGHGSIDLYRREIIALYNGEKKDSIEKNTFIWEPLYRHYNKWVRSGGHIPTLRVGAQPYGILPITNRPKPFPDPVKIEPLSSSDFYKKYDHFMHELANMWLGRLKVPLLDPNATDGNVGGSPETDVKTISEVLGAVPNPVNLHIREMTRSIEKDMEKFSKSIALFDSAMDINAPTGIENQWAASKLALDKNATNIFAQIGELDTLETAINTHVSKNATKLQLRKLLLGSLRPPVEKYKDQYAKTPHLWNLFQENGPLVTEVKNKAGRERIPNLAGSEFSKTISPIEFRINEYEELEELYDLLNVMITTLKDLKPGKSPDPQIKGEAPLLFHLLHETYLNYPSNGAPALIAIFKQIQNKITPALEDETQAPQTAKEITLMMQEVLGLLMYRLDAWVTSRAAQGLSLIHI